MEVTQSARTAAGRFLRLVVRPLVAGPDVARPVVAHPIRAPVLLHFDLRRGALRLITFVDLGAQGFGGVFRGGYVDVEARTPLEPGHLSQARHDLEMPVVVAFVSRRRRRRGVQHTVERRIAQHLGKRPEHTPEHPCKVHELALLHPLKEGIMVLGHDHDLKRQVRRVWRERDEMLRFVDDAPAVCTLLPDHITQRAAFLVTEIVFGTLQLLQHALGHHRKTNQLRVAVRLRRACLLAVVLEYEHIAQRRMAHEVDQPVAIRPEDLLELPVGRRPPGVIVPRRLNDHLVHTEPSGHVVHAFAYPLQRRVGIERRELVGDHPYPPIGRIPLTSCMPVGCHLRRGHRLIALAERALRVTRRHVRRGYRAWA